MEKVKKYHWVSSQDLEKMMEDTIVIFADEFASSNRVKSARSLKTSRDQKVKNIMNHHLFFLLFLLWDVV